MGANVLIKGHKCYRCGHEWRPINIGSKELPRTCPNPKCKSPFWDRPVTRKKTSEKIKNLRGSERKQLVK